VGAGAAGADAVGADAVGADAVDDANRVPWPAAGTTAQTRRVARAVVIPRER
jgi:hypothetical protein